MYLAIILLPLLGSISSGFFGRKIGVSGSQLITTSCVILITIFSIISFFEVGFNNIPVTIELFKWIDSESLYVLWAFNFDSLTVSMLIPVLTVSSLVHLYSIGYMSHDPHNQRFFSYLSLFTFMMVILVTANNFLLMFVGWEGVGLCSYLLVSFWFTRIAANQSSISALLTNRVGDCFLTIGMFAILWSFGNIDYSTVFSLAPYVSENIVTIIGICLLIGAMAKSSQVGLHVWLPMAMEGPTPVSALIHAATMVTAGVYLLMRSSPLIEYSSTVLMLALWIGAFTTVFSSLVGLFQQDIKKVIAYSTMSQLGMMVIAVGLSSYNIALFHLINHAFYKALLFLGAGSVIHAWADNQDFRKYGGLRPFLPLTYSVMLIASLSLVAFPFMTGFYSKDFILESAYGQFTFFSVAVYFIATIGAMFTTLYSVKVLYITFLSNPNGPMVNYKMAHEGDIFMSLPLIILAILSIFFGYITKDIFIGLGSGFFADNGLFIHPNNEILVDTEFAVPTLFKILPFLLTISLGVISFTFSEYYYKLILLFKLSRFGYNLFSFFNQRFYIELFYNTYITDLVLKLGGQTTKVLDKGSIELIGPFGLEKGLVYLSNTTKKLDTGVITNYALYILVGLVAYITLPFVFSNLLVLMLIALLNLASNFNSVNKNTSNYVSIQSNLFNLSNLKNIKNKILFMLLVYMMFTSCFIFFTNSLNLPYFKFILIGMASYLSLIVLNNFNKKLFTSYTLIIPMLPIAIIAIFKICIYSFCGDICSVLFEPVICLCTLCFSIFSEMFNSLQKSVCLALFNFISIKDKLSIPNVFFMEGDSTSGKEVVLSSGKGGAGSRPASPRSPSPGVGASGQVGPPRFPTTSRPRFPLAISRPLAQGEESRPLFHIEREPVNTGTSESSLKGNPKVYHRAINKGFDEVEATKISTWPSQNTLKPEQYPGNILAGYPYNPDGSKELLNSLARMIVKYDGSLRDKDFSENQKKYLTEFFNHRNVDLTALQTRHGISFAKLCMLDMDTLRFMLAA